MEDQQPATGDLTDESAVDTVAADSETAAAPATSDAVSPGSGDETVAADAATSESDDTEIADETADAATEDDEAVDGGDEVVRFRRRPAAGRLSVIVAAVAAALFVAAGAFAGAMLQPYLIDRATVATLSLIHI